MAYHDEADFKERALSEDGKKMFSARANGIGSRRLLLLLPFP
jgi:hypothetical protein